MAGKKENNSSKSIERTMKNLDVNLHYMQEEFFAFLWFIVFLVLSFFVSGMYSMLFIGLSIFSFIVFMIII